MIKSKKPSGPLEAKTGAQSHRLIASNEKPKILQTPIKDPTQPKIQPATSEKSARSSNQYSHVKSKFSAQQTANVPMEERLIQEQLDKRMKIKIQAIQNDQKAGKITFQQAIERINKTHLDFQKQLEVKLQEKDKVRDQMRQLQQNLASKGRPGEPYSGSVYQRQFINRGRGSRNASSSNRQGNIDLKTEETDSEVTNIIIGEDQKVENYNSNQPYGA